MIRSMSLHSGRVFTKAGKEIPLHYGVINSVEVPLRRQIRDRMLEIVNNLATTW